MSEHENAALPRRRAGVELQVEGVRTVLLAKKQDAVFELDPLGRAIWELCDGTNAIEEIAVAVCKVFDVDGEAATRDVARLVEQLRTAGLVDRA